VKNFDERVDEEKLKELFSQFGNIKSVIVKQSAGLPGLAYGFVEYEVERLSVRSDSFHLSNK